MLSKNRLSISASIVLLVLGAGVAAYWALFNSSSPVGASTLVLQADQTAEEILEQLGPDKALHINSSYYARLGPSAAEVAESDWPQPEESYAETWLVFGPGGLLVDEKGIAKDANGDPWQEFSRMGDELIRRNFYNGKTRSNPWLTVSADDYVSRMSDKLAKSIQGEPVDEGKLYGLDSVIFEVRRPIDPEKDYPKETGYTIPDFSDLQGETMIAQTELVVQNPFLMRWSVYVADKDGNRHLVEEQRVSSVEVVDR